MLFIHECFMIKLLCFVVILLNVGYADDKSLDDSCAVADSGRPGTCKFFNDCPDALILKHKFKPAHCGYLRKKEIICCPNEMQKIISTDPQTTMRISQKSILFLLKYEFNFQ